MKSDDVGVVGDFQPVLAGLWREACHHIEIGDFAVTVAKILTEYMPIGQLLVRRVDKHRPSIDTVAVGFSSPDYLLPDARSECSTEKMEEVTQWCQQGRVARRGAQVGPMHPWKFSCPRVSAVMSSWGC